MGKLLRLKQVAEMLDVTDRTVQNLILRGEMHGFQVGDRWRVEEEEVAAYIERQKQKASEKQTEESVA